MKKLLVSMIGLFILYFVLKGTMFLFRGNTVHTYELVDNGNVTTVIEKRNTKTKNTDEYYDFEIKSGKQQFSFRLLEKDLSGHERFIKKIEMISTSNYQCYLPIFKDDKILIDMMCMNKKNKMYYPYHQIRLSDTKLDATVDKEYLSKIKKFMVQTDAYTEKSGLSIASSIPNQIRKIGVSTYRGISLIDNKGDVKQITLFASDKYDQPLHAFLDGYYFVANYDESYDFQRMYLINLKTEKVDTIISPVKVSFDAYIQGTVNHKIYIMDKSNRTQYYFDLEDKLLHKCDNQEDLIQYYNGTKFESRNIYDALNQELLFESEHLVRKSNTEILEFDKTSNYYYLFKKNKDKYEVYRSLDKNLNELTYLYTADSFTHIYYRNGIIYENQDEVSYYSNSSGTKKVFKNKEFGFNKSVIFGALE